LKLWGRVHAEDAVHHKAYGREDQTAKEPPHPLYYMQFPPPLQAGN